jgi:hypothetical protein
MRDLEFEDSMGMVVALAGRRVDAAGAKEGRFPAEPESIERVRGRIRAVLIDSSAIALVSSAACGADLLALEQAGMLSLRRKIVLPYGQAKFRVTSVNDRPGNWGLLFDTVLSEVDAKGDLTVLQPEVGSEAFIEANHTIIENAMALGADLRCPVGAVRVWEGKGRRGVDLTEEFGLYAQKRGIPIIDVLTV